MLKNTFLYRAALHESKKRLYREAKNFISRKLYELHSKPLSYAQKLLLHKRFFAVRKNFSFSQVKSFLPTQTFLVPTQSNPFTPSTFHSYTLNLLFAKNTAVLLLFALTPCAVKPERRTDSNHCRRCSEHYSFPLSRLPDECRSFQKKSRIDRRFESSPESRGSQTFGVLLVLFVHAKSTKNVPFTGSSEVLPTSNQRTAAAASRRNN